MSITFNTDSNGKQTPVFTLNEDQSELFKKYDVTLMGIRAEHGWIDVVRATVKDQYIFFDCDDLDLFLSCTSWCRNGHYLIGWVNGNTQYFHRLVVSRNEPIPDDRDVDHINRVKCDCRKVNLRIVSHRTNSLNTARGSSQFNWVYKTPSNTWQVKMTIDKLYSFGTYGDEETAARVADAVAYHLISDELEETDFNFPERISLDDIPITEIAMNHVRTLEEQQQ